MLNTLEGVPSKLAAFFSIQTKCWRRFVFIQAVAKIQRQLCKRVGDYLWEKQMTKTQYLILLALIFFRPTLNHQYFCIPQCGLTHLVPWNAALIPHGCAHATHGTRPSFCKLYFCRLGKHSRTETSFKMNFHQMKGETSITSFCIVLMFKSAKIWWLVKEIFVFRSIWSILFKDDVCEHKTGDLDDGWVLDCKYIGEEEIDIASVSDGNTAILAVEMWAFYLVFLAPPQLCSSWPQYYLG